MLEQNYRIEVFRDHTSEGIILQFWGSSPIDLEWHFVNSHSSIHSQAFIKSLTVIPHLVLDIDDTDGHDSVPAPVVDIDTLLRKISKGRLGIPYDHVCDREKTQCVEHTGHSLTMVLGSLYVLIGKVIVQPNLERHIIIRQVKQRCLVPVKIV